MTKFVSSESDAVASDNSQVKVTVSRKVSIGNSPVAQTDKAVTAFHPNSALPTVGQLMRTVSQKLLRLYREQLNHTPKDITCYLFSNKLVVWVDGGITDVEKRLVEAGSERLSAAREALNNLLKPKIARVVEGCTDVGVVTLMMDTCYEQNCTVIVVLLAGQPQTRPAKRQMSNL
ncbi:MAG: Na-translocating system protein MpsC family protein [Cyanobacteria bacterium J06554_11]